MKGNLKKNQKAGEKILTSHPIYGLAFCIIGMTIFGITYLFLQPSYTIFYISSVAGWVVLSTGLYIIYKQQIACGGFNKSTNRAKVKGKMVTTCMFCPIVNRQPNIWDKKQFTYRCPDKGDKFNYFPTTVPGWCPYLVK